MTQRASFYLSPNLSIYGAPDVAGIAPISTWHSDLQFADELESQQAEWLNWHNQITPQIAAATVEISNIYPWLTPGVVTGAAFAGMDPQDPALKWLADREAQRTNEGGSGIGSIIGSVLSTPFTLLKGSTRMVTTGFGMMWEEGLTRPLRTSVGINQGIGSGRAYELAGASIGTRAIGDAFGGEGNLGVGERLEAFVRNVTPLPSLPGQEVNLGGGFLPQSNFADTNDAQVQALSDILVRQGIPQARAEAQAIQSVQQSYGRPISQQARQQAETGITIQDNKGRHVSVSPGRLAAVGFGMDSDTTAFNVVSGIGDFAAQIFLDPTNIALGGISKARLASRLLTKGNRTSRVFGRNVDDFASSAFYNEKLIPSLTGMTSPTDVKNALGLTRPGASKLRTRSLIANIVDSTDNARTAEVLYPYLGTTIRKAPQPENIASIFGGYGGKTVGQRLGGSENLYKMLGSSPDEAARLAANGEVFGLKVGVKHRLDGTAMGRLFSETSGRIIDTTDMDGAYFQFDNWLNNAGMHADDQDELLLKFARLGDSDHQGAFQVAKEAMAKWEKKITDELVANGDDPQFAQKWAHSFTRMFDSQDDFVKYWVSQADNPAVFPSGHVKVIANGEHQILEMKPTVHMISEMVARQLPMPDPKEMRRLLSELSHFPVSKITARRTLKNGTDAAFEARVMTNITDLYMQKVWKPMVLLRFAWPVRVIGEEQFRLAGAGKMSAINHPFQWLAFATGRKGNRTLMDAIPDPKDVEKALRKGSKGETIDIPKGLEEFYSALASGTGGWLNTKGQIVSVAGYTTVKAGDPNYVDALIWNMGKLNANAGIIQKMEKEGIDATAKWLHSGEGQPLLRKLKDAQNPTQLESLENVNIYLQSVQARAHVTAGGSYIWWDSAALRWRDHFDQFLDPDLAPPPPRGFDVDQPPLPGMNAAPVQPDASAGLGPAPYRKPGYGRQGQFDTDFQPRIQREKQGDYRAVDRFLNGDQQEIAYRTGQVSGVFGDSIPLDRTWGQFSGATDHELTNRLGQAMVDWSGASTFDNLSHVDENLDLVFQELLLRHGSTFTVDGRSNLRAAFLVGRGDSVSQSMGGRIKALSLEETSELTGAIGRQQLANDLLDMVSQYEAIDTTRSLFKELDRVAGRVPSDPTRAILSQNASPIRASAALDELTTVETAFLSSFQDILANAPDGAGLRFIDQALDDARVLASSADTRSLPHHLDDVVENIKRDISDYRREFEFSDSWDAAIRDVAPTDFVDFRDRSIAARLTDGADEVADEFVYVYVDGEKYDALGRHSVVAGSANPDDFTTPRKVTLAMDGPVPEIEMSDLLNAYLTVPNASKVPKNADDIVAIGLNAYRDVSPNLGPVIDQRGFKVVMDEDAVRWLAHEGVEGADTAGGWRVPTKRIADENAVGIRSRPMVALGEILDVHLDSTRGLDRNFLKFASSGADEASDDLLTSSIGMRRGLLTERTDILEESVNQYGFSVSKQLNGNAYSGRSTNSVVSEIIQYGQTWKGSTLHDGEAAFLWSSEIDSLMGQLVNRRIAALSDGTIDAFDDEVLDSIFDIADKLGVSPSVLMDEFDQALDTGMRLSDAGIDLAGASYRSPLGQTVLPSTVADQMDVAPYAMSHLPFAERAAAWDDLADDASVYVYAWVSGDEAHKLATQGWDGGPLLVSTNPDIAAYYSVPLSPSGDGLPALGHGRIGPPLEGTLEGGIGATSGNLVGPGLYTTSHGGVLGGAYGSGDAGSITQIRWNGSGAPRVFDVNGSTAYNKDAWMRIRAELVKLMDDPPDEVAQAPGFHIVRGTQSRTWQDQIQGTLDDIDAVFAGKADPDGYAMYQMLLGENEATHIAANEAVARAGYDAISHMGGGFGAASSDTHRVYVWLWKAMREGKVSGEPLARQVTDGQTGVRAVGRERNINKLVAMRVTKGDVAPSFKARVGQTDGEALAEFGLGGQISRNLDPEEVRFVSHSGSQLGTRRPLEQPHIQQLSQVSRTATPNVDYIPQVTQTAVDQARARGVRVQYYTATDGDGIVLSASGGTDQYIEVTINSAGAGEVVSNVTHSGVARLETVDGLPALLRQMEPPPSSRSLFTSSNRTTSNVVGDIKALGDLPADEAAILRNALDDMPPAPEQLRAIRDTDVPFQDIKQPDIGPPKPDGPSPMDIGKVTDDADRWFILQGEADEGLKEMILTRKYKIGEGTGEEGADEFLNLPGELDTIGDDLRGYVDNLQTQGKLPDKVPYRDMDVSDDARSMLDKALTTSFYHMMSRPTNFLSRAPAWKQSYIQRVVELRSFATVKVQREIDDLLYGATADGGFGLTKRNVRTIIGHNPVAIDDYGGTLTSMRTIDDLAKSFALEETKDLLYDATKRHNITDITRNIFPFAEAWAEVIGVWGRIAFEHPEVLRRAQQGIEGARESGIFFDNENGEEVFAYPGLDLIGNWMLGVDTPGAGVEFTGRTAGVNIALGGFLPGFGPTVQLPVSMAADHMPVGWDWVSELVSPFGGTETDFKPGSLIDMGLPTWYRRGLEAIGVGGREYQQKYFNSVIDTFKLKTLEDSRILDDPTLANAALADSFNDARMIGLLRTFATFFLPTGPQVTYKAGDIEGKNWTFQALTSEYYAILAKNDYDHQVAYREFEGRFGFDPTTFTTAKSVGTIKRSTTKSGDDWFRNNEDLFDHGAFPTTAAYAMPDLPWDEFDYDAYRRQLEDDARQGVSPEVWTMRRNQLVGSLQYEHARDLTEGRSDPAALRWLRQIRVDLTHEYPGFGLKEIPGVPGRATLDQKLLELEGWADDPRLSESDAGKGLAVYLELRNQAQVRAMEHGFTPSGFQTANKMEYIREWLRVQAAQIMATYPDFSTLWFDIFARELEEANAPKEPLSVGGLSFKESA